MIQVSCAECGVEFSLPNGLQQRRREDHQTFYCPNGHSNYYAGKTEKEKRIEMLEERLNRYSEMADEVFAQREELLGALKECPIHGCAWRSRKQISRDAFSMGRGIERVRSDMLEHFVRDHAAQAAYPQKLLEAPTS